MSDDSLIPISDEQAKLGQEIVGAPEETLASTWGTSWVIFRKIWSGFLWGTG